MQICLSAGDKKDGFTSDDVIPSLMLPAVKDDDANMIWTDVIVPTWFNKDAPCGMRWALDPAVWLPGKTVKGLGRADVFGSVDDAEAPESSAADLSKFMKVDLSVAYFQPFEDHDADKAFKLTRAKTVFDPVDKDWDIEVAQAASVKGKMKEGGDKLLNADKPAIVVKKAAAKPDKDAKLSKGRILS